MKIIFLTRRFWPDIGGVEKHVFEVSRLLVKKGHKVTVVTQSQGEETEIDGIKTIRIGTFPKNSSEKLHIWKWFWKNRELIRGANVIHAHDVYFWYWPYKLLSLSKKSFVTFHGYENYPIRKRAIISRKISEYLADGNIVVGEFIKKWYHTKADCVTYGAVEISNFKFQISNKPKSESAVFIGRLDEHTGILGYAKAVELIRKKYPKFEFKIIGDGKFANRLKKYKPLGFKNNSQDYLRQSNFAFVSRYLSILEELEHKRLVFALYDNPVKEDYLRMTPFSKFVIIADSPEKVANKVSYFLKNPSKAEKMKNDGYNWVRNQTWDNVVKIYLKLWKIP